MNNSGDAAEQVVRLSLEGTEVALKLTGSAAKNIAAAIYAVLKNRDKNKIKGRQRLTAMLKSGKELKVFTISEEHLKQFATEAKRYGVVYCALRGKEKSADGMVDVMVRAEDASKINRIVERFHLATVDTASIKHEIEKTRAEKGAGEKMEAPAVPEKGQPEKSDEDKLLDEMLGAPTRKEEYEIVAAFKTVAYSQEGFKYYHFVNAEDEAAFDEFIAECKALALYDTGVTAEYGDKLITLSTCEYSRTNGRMVIVAKLVVPSAEEVDADAGH